MEGEMATHNVLSISRVVSPRGDYPGTYRVLIETIDEGVTFLSYEHTTAIDELDAYRRIKSWLDSAVCDYELKMRKAINVSDK